MALKKNLPFFSVVIPLFNKENYIKDTLNSVLNQTYQDFEIIVVNDGSTDESLKILNTIDDKRIKVLSQNNLGASQARNRGIKEAYGHYIALLDADDIWYNNHLIELRKLINSFPEAGLFCNNYEIKRYEKKAASTSFNFNYTSNCLVIKDFFEANIIDCIPTSSSVAFLKTSFNKTGGYDISIPSGQDTGLWIAFGLLYKIAFNPVVTMVYNNYDKNSLSNSKFNSDRYKLINSYKKDENSNTSLKKYLDINRYSLAIKCLFNKEIDLYEKLKKEINHENLSYKQKTLLRSPRFLLKSIKYIQQALIKYNIYFTAYK